MAPKEPVSAAAAAAKSGKATKKKPISNAQVFIVITAVIVAIFGLSLWTPAASNEEAARDLLLKKAREIDAHLNEGQRDLAIESLYEALSLGIDVPEFYYNLAVTMMEVGEYEKAIPELHAAIAKLEKGDPKRADAHINLALANRQLGNITGSIFHWKQAAKMKPKRSDLSFSTGNALKSNGELHEALMFFEAAHKVAPSNPKYLVAMAQTKRELGFPDEETAALSEKALKVGNAMDHFELAVWVENEQPGTAIVHLKRFMELDSRHPNIRSALYIMGRIYHRLEAFEPEESLYKLAVERNIWADTRQRPGIMFRKLTPSAPFPWENITSIVQGAIDLLEDNYATIKAEVLSTVKLGDASSPYLIDMRNDDENITDAGTWKQAVFVRNGISIEKTFNNFPQTGSVLNKLISGYSKDMPKASMELSVLAPGTHLKPHCGPTNHRLRLHLGLVVPSETSIVCGGETRHWTEGKVLVLDDSFEHEVWNNATTPRAVLLVDIWHPLLDSQDKEDLRKGLQWSRRVAPELGYH